MSTQSIPPSAPYNLRPDINIPLLSIGVPPALLSVPIDEEDEEPPSYPMPLLSPQTRALVAQGIFPPQAIQQKPFQSINNPPPSEPPPYEIPSVTPSDFTFPSFRDRNNSPLGNHPMRPYVRPHKIKPDTRHEREKYLERNRVAASKCRQKKKRETLQLRDQYQEEAHRKMKLEGEVKVLHTELLDLKDQLLRHSRCDDEAIQCYLGQMVNMATTHDNSSVAGSERSSISAAASTSAGSVLENLSPNPNPNPMGVLEGQPLPLPADQSVPSIPTGTPTGIPDSMPFACAGVAGGIEPYMDAQPMGNIFDQLIRIP